LQNAWNKYGEQSFVFEILEYCEPDKLIEREQLYIDWFKCCDREIGFNLKPSAQNSLGYKHTEEAKAKIKANSIRLGCRPPSPLGRKHSEETKLKQSLAKKGKKRKFKVKRKPHSEETKNKIRLAHLGKKLSEETKNKIIKSLIGNQRGKKKNEPSRPSPG
jgi:group I intron endonuclease